MTPLRLFFRAHWFGIMMVVVGILPGLNQLYCGHGGLAWFALPLSFPLVADLMAAFRATRPRGV